MLRFAPSPTGDMHIDNLRIAIINYLVAQQNNDQFLIRIEDTDTKLNIEGKDTEIMMILEKFALKHDSVYHQTERLNLHQTLAIRLLKEEKAFICKCLDKCSGKCENLTQKDYTTLKKSAEPFVLRVKQPNNNIIFNDVLQKSITTTPSNIDSFIILKTDGTPSHNFASACDDMLSDIELIIQEKTSLLNAPKQIHIKNLLGYEKETKYAHLSTLSADKTLTVRSLFEQGFIPDAIVNYLLLLDNTNAPKEIFTLPEAIEWFDLKAISTASLKFDMTQLRFINREHIKMMDDKKLSTLFGFADADIGKLAKVYLEECSTINELEEKIRPIFSSKDFDGEWGEQMKVMAELISNAPTFETFDELKKHLTEKCGLKGEKLLKPLHHLLTKTGNGPELSKVYPLIKSYILEVAS